MNQSLYNQLLNAAAVAIKQSEFNDEIAKKRREQEIIVHIKSKNAGGCCIPFITVGIMIMALGVIPYLVSLFWWPFAWLSAIAWLTTGEPECLISFACWVITWGFFLMGCAMFFTSLGIKRSREKRVAIKYEYMGKAGPDRKYNAIEQEKQEIQSVLDTYSGKAEEYISFLPEDYRNLQAIGFMLQAVKNCRADTLKEAINLYELEIRVLKQNSRANSTVAMKQYSTYALDAVNQNKQLIHDALIDINKSFEMSTR